MVYQTNTLPLGVNALIQMIDFLNSSGLYENGLYSWHNDMIDVCCQELQSHMPTLPYQQRVDIVIGLSRISIPPVLEIINDFVSSMSIDQFKISFCNLYMETENFSKIADTGLHYLSEEDYACALLCRPISSIPKLDIQKEIPKIASTVLCTVTRDVPVSDLPWTKFTFTSAGKVGAYGPSRDECIIFYNDAWVQDMKLFNVKKGKQWLTIPKGGLYKITAYGAGRGRVSGAIISGTFLLPLGCILEMVIGQQGTEETLHSTRQDSAGNGGTFVVLQRYGSPFIPLVIAGGGAGASGPVNLWSNGNTLEEGGRSTDPTSNTLHTSSGYTGRSEHFNGGAGFQISPREQYSGQRLTNEKNLPQPYKAGMTGGVISATKQGGFGGGGAPCFNAGGGGYTGGHGSNNSASGGGGGSFTADPNGRRTNGWFESGKCVIKYIPSAVEVVSFERFDTKRPVG